MIFKEHPELIDCPVIYLWKIFLYRKTKKKYQIDAQHEGDSEVLKLLQILILFVKRNNNNNIEQIKTSSYPGNSYFIQIDEDISVKISKFLQTTAIIHRTLNTSRVQKHTDWKYVTLWHYLPYHTSEKLGKL